VYRPNCGAIACGQPHRDRTIRAGAGLSGCAVTERFALKTKYFYDEQNLEAFREEYAAMPIHEKAMENKVLTAGGVVTAVVLLLGILALGGVI